MQACLEEGILSLQQKRAAAHMKGSLQGQQEQRVALQGRTRAAHIPVHPCIAQRAQELPRHTPLRRGEQRPLCNPIGLVDVTALQRTLWVCTAPCTIGSRCKPMPALVSGPTSHSCAHSTTWKGCMGHSRSLRTRLHLCCIESSK